MKPLLKQLLFAMMLCLGSHGALALQTSPGLNLKKGPGDPYFTSKTILDPGCVGNMSLTADSGGCVYGDPGNFITTTTKHYGSFAYNDTSSLKNDPSATTFNLKDLIGTSIKGMLNKSCGSGYCITGVCARWSIIISLLHGIHLYTYISPQIRDTLPVLLISAYNGVGREPLKEWRDTVGASLAALNTGVIGPLIGLPDGLQSDSIGQSNPNQPEVMHKEIDIIGHPLAALPDLVNNGHISFSGYQLPGYGKLANLTNTVSNAVNKITGPSTTTNTNGANTTTTTTAPGKTQSIGQKATNLINSAKKKANNLINSAKKKATNLINGAKQKLADIKKGMTIKNIKKKITGIINDLKKKMSVANITATVKQKLSTALSSLSAVKKVKAIQQNIQTVRNIKKYVDKGLQGFEAISQGALIASGIGIIGSARFGAPRLFCPTTIKAWQPYYLTFADAFWWRAGYPITDGPISGSNHSSTIFNPVSLDTLPPYNSVKDVLTKPVWGHMYPRDGQVVQPYDAKAASVLAWRGLDVLEKEVKAGNRVGVPLPESVEPGKWQLIFPEVRQCRKEPDYPHLKEAKHGGYAWNYYKTTQCCSGTKGQYKLTTLTFKQVGLPDICIPASKIAAANAQDKIDYQNWLKKNKKKKKK